MDKLRVRVYDVRFGDAILITVPDRSPTSGRTTTRNILIDVGNVLNDKSGLGGGDDELFERVVDDIKQVLGNKSLDLYVMTHEHMDHVQGLLYAKDKLNKTIPVRYAWLTASSALDYYQTHPEAEKEKNFALSIYRDIELYLKAVEEVSGDGNGGANESPFAGLMINNDFRETGKCVSYLRTLAKTKTSYIFRGCDLTGTHPFKEATFEIWAPEEDTSDYYGQFQPMALNLAPGDGAAVPPGVELPIPPSGVDAGAFYNLVDIRSRGFSDNLLAIDRAANNSSIVFSLEWRGWRLLFPGDAEVRSWKTMNREGMLKPVHLLKMSHHGSHNGTPSDTLLEKILPTVPPDNRPRRAVVSTRVGPYSGVPDSDTRLRVAQRCQQYISVEELPADKFFFDVEFEG